MTTRMSEREALDALLDLIGERDHLPLIKAAGLKRGAGYRFLDGGAFYVERVDAFLGVLKLGWEDLLQKVREKRGESPQPVRLVEQPPEQDELEATLIRSVTETMNLVHELRARRSGAQSGYPLADVKSAVAQGVAAHVGDPDTRDDMMATIIGFLCPDGEEPSRGKQTGR